MDRDASAVRNWELAAESIIVRIRIFGVLMGYVLVGTRTGLHDPGAVREFLALGAGYATLDLVFHRLGKVFLKKWPIFVSTMEALFIGLLCYNDSGLESPFRWYYLLSAICCAIRFRPAIAWTSFGLQCLSLMALASTLGPSRDGLATLPLTIVIIAWATWATSSLAGLLKATGDRLEVANSDLERSHAELERRVAERSEALRASQARVIHQEKMAAFGLLAAGIAHEVGNPLAATSSLIQILRRRHPSGDTSEKLGLADRQLGRIQRTIRELIDFARPAPQIEASVRIAELVDEALSIAKYYQRTKDRGIMTMIPADLPPVLAVRDRLMQVVLNLVFNAVDATSRGGKIVVEAVVENGIVALRVEDDGRGIGEADEARIFQPYFTTKPQGTGLGLFVSRQIVEELGGTIAFESRPGEGTIFTVRLPAFVEEPRSAWPSWSIDEAVPALQVAADGGDS